MPVVLREYRKSRSFKIARDKSSSWGKLEFRAYGSWDEEEIKAACDALIPSTFMGMFLQDYEPEPQGGGTTRCWWTVQVNYSPLKPKDEDNPQYSFDTSAQTQHVTVSKATLDSARIESDDPAPDFGGCIGVNGDTVEGVDVHVPTFSFSETHYIPAELVTGAYKLQLFQLTAKTNLTPWRGLERGEVLFLGAQGSIRGNEQWEISYKCSCQANAEDIEIPGTDDVIPFKFGWDYLWYRFQEEVDSAAHFRVRKPYAWYIEQLYDEAELLLLGIGA